MAEKPKLEEILQKIAQHSPEYKPEMPSREEAEKLLKKIDKSIEKTEETMQEMNQVAQKWQQDRQDKIAVYEPKQSWLRRAYESITEKVSDSYNYGLLEKICGIGKKVALAPLIMGLAMWYMVSFAEKRDPGLKEDTNYKKILIARYCFLAGGLLFGLSTCMNSCRSSMILNEMKKTDASIAYFEQDDVIALIDIKDVGSKKIPKRYVKTAPGQKENLRYSSEINTLFYSVNDEAGDELYAYSFENVFTNEPFTHEFLIIGKKEKLQIDDFFYAQGKVQIKTKEGYYIANLNGTFAKSSYLPQDTESDKRITVYGNENFNFFINNGSIELIEEDQALQSRALQPVENFLGFNGNGQIRIKDTKVHCLHPVYLVKQEKK